jgi:WD40 repeat protein
LAGRWHPCGCVLDRHERLRPPAAPADGSEARIPICFRFGFFSGWEKAGDEYRPEGSPLESAAPSVSCLVFSGDGKTIAGGVGHSINLWDAGTGRIEKTLEGHTRLIKGIGFSLDGKTLVSAASLDDRYSPTNVELWLWDLNAGKKVADIKAGQAIIIRLLMAPDQKSFATASMRSVKVWDLGQKKQLANLQHDGSITSLAFSPDDKSLAVADTQAIVVLWDTDTWKQKSKIEGPEDLIINSLAFSPNGKFLAWGCEDQTVQIWEVATGKLVTTLPGHSQAVTEVAYGSGDNTLASGAQDGDVRLWNISSGQTRITLK